MTAPSKAFISFARRFPVIQPILVQWGDMDAYKHVNNVQYFRYFETARMAHTRELLRAIPQSSSFDGRGFIDATAVGPILASSSCVFKVPVEFPDLLFAGSSIVGAAAHQADHIEAPAASKDRFVMEYALFSVNADRVAASGQGTIVLYDYRSKRKAAGTPEGLLQAMRTVESRAARRTDADVAGLAAAARALGPQTQLGE